MTGNVKQKSIRISIAVLIIGVASLVGCGIMGDSPPGLALVIDGESTDLAQGSYCWARLCADTEYPPVISTFVTLGGDGQITLEFDRPYPDSAFVGLASFDDFPQGEYDASMRFDDPSQPITWMPDLPAGDYVLSVSAQWDNGNDATYDVGVTIP